MKRKTIIATLALLSLLSLSGCKKDIKYHVFVVSNYNMSFEFHNDPLDEQKEAFLSYVRDCRLACYDVLDLTDKNPYRKYDSSKKSYSSAKKELAADFQKVKIPPVPDFAFDEDTFCTYDLCLAGNEFTQSATSSTTTSATVLPEILGRIGIILADGEIVAVLIDE